MKSCNKILVSGLINHETTLEIDKFPINYSSINSPSFAINSVASGEALSISKALKVLGDNINLVSMIGKDLYGEMILNKLKKYGINDTFVNQTLKNTVESVVLCDKNNKKQIYLDLNNMKKVSYDNNMFREAMKESSIIVLCNPESSECFFQMAKESGKIVATSSNNLIKDITYSNKSIFMNHVNILYINSENINEPVEDYVKIISKEYDNEIIVVNFRNEGSLLYVRKDNFVGRYPFVKTRKIVDYNGYDTALFSAFLHCYNKSNDPYISLKKSLCFASYKMGEYGERKGFITDEKLEQLYNFLYN